MKVSLKLWGVVLLLQVAVCSARVQFRGDQGRGVTTEKRFLGSNTLVRHVKAFARWHESGHGMQLRERESQGDMGMVDPSGCPSIEPLSLLTGCKTVLMESRDPAFVESSSSSSLRNTCYVSISNIVYGPDGNKFYYVASQVCVWSDLNIVSKVAMSIMEADLTEVNSEGLIGLATTRVVSPWWRATAPNGSAPVSAEVFGPQDSMNLMAQVLGVEMSKMGTHLLLTTSSRNPQDPSWIVTLNIATGSRMSIPVSAAMGANGLTFNPAKSKLYVSGAGFPVAIPAEIFEGSVMEPDVPTSSLFLTSAVRFGNMSGFNISTPWIGPYSFSGDGSCLYFIDQVYGRVWTFAPSTNDVTLIAVGSNDTTWAKSGLSSPISVAMQGLPIALAVTSDGLNVLFTTGSGEVFHLTMLSPCGTPWSVVELTKHPLHLFNGLAIDEGKGTLLVGTTGGHVLEFTTTLTPRSPTIGTSSPVEPSSYPSSFQPLPTTTMSNLTAFASFPAYTP